MEVTKLNGNLQEHNYSNTIKYEFAIEYEKELQYGKEDNQCF